MFGVYSEKQRQYNAKKRRETIRLESGLVTAPAAVEYTRPDGTTVICTAVGTVRNCPGTEWDDKVDVGEVLKFVRSLEF